MILKNVLIKVDDSNVLTLQVKLEERHGLSNSGKTVIVASTGGTVYVDGDDGKTYGIGLNVFTKRG